MSTLTVLLNKTETEIRPKKTTIDLNVFYWWAKTVNETRRLEETLPEELDKLLAHFFLKARKQNGDDFEPLIH